MKRIFLFSTLFAALFSFSACNSSDSIITCDRYDRWLASCSMCSTTLSCEDNYDTLAPTVQVDLNDCADNVLLDNIGVCGSTSPSWNAAIQECLDLGAQYLGITCHYDVCGDGACTGTETEANCPEDCAVDTCGDGTCQDYEDPVACPDDCAYLVCDDYQDWLETCFADCTAADTCDAEYGTLDAATAASVLDCAVLLADAAAAGQCADNINGTCDVMLEEELGSFGSCTY